MAVILITCRSIIRLKSGRPFYLPLTSTAKPYAKSSAVTCTESTVTTEKNVQIQSNREPLDLSFENTVEAFKSKTTWEIIRAILVLKLSTIDYLVENHQKVS